MFPYNILTYEMYNKSHSSTATLQAKLLKSKQYLAHEGSVGYASWEKFPGRDNAHTLMKDGEAAILVVVGQILTDRLAMGPLGTFQIQEEKQFDSGFRIECKDTKISFFLGRPTSHENWAQDFDMAIKNVTAIQEKVAVGTAPRLWFLDKNQQSATLKFGRNLWEKKVNVNDRCSSYTSYPFPQDFFPDDNGNEGSKDGESDDDDSFKKRKEYAMAKGQSTFQYF
jgi:hypothetical protein